MNQRPNFVNIPSTAPGNSQSIFFEYIWFYDAITQNTFGFDTINRKNIFGFMAKNLQNTFGFATLSPCLIGIF